MIGTVMETAVDRLRASDPGWSRSRRALSAILGIGIAVSVLVPIGLPLPVVLVGSVSALMAAFTISDPEPAGQAVSLGLVFVVGAAALTAASLGQAVPPLDGIVFVLLIFVAVYAQRFGVRGIALGSAPFFLFFFAMFLQTQVHQVPVLLLALATGLGANAIVRFVLLPRRAGRELLAIRRSFRTRLSASVTAAANHLAAGGTQRTGKQLRRAGDRLHEAVLLIEDTIADVFDDPKAAALLRRRALEVELAAQWLAITTRRVCAENLDEAVRDDLVTRLQRFRSLIERDPRELPVIADTREFSELLVSGSRLGDRTEPGDDVRRAIAELALADLNAQRIAENDFSAEAEPPEGEEAERTRVFAYDNKTRSAIQAVLGGGLAVVGGELVSHQRWYWAVLTVFVVFLGTSSAGATLIKSARRIVGTIVGIFAGALCALVVAENVPATIVLILVCVFGMVFFARASQVAMTFFITTMLGLLYSLLGTFSIDVLGVRLAETAVGAASGVLAAVVIVPVRTRAVMLDDVATALEDLREYVTQARALLSGVDNVNVIELSRTLDRDVEQVRAVVEPLTHPISLRAARRDYGWYVLDTLDAVAFRARHIAARARPGLLALDDRLDTVTTRITHNIDVLLDTIRSSPGIQGHIEPPPGDDGIRPDDEPAPRVVLASFAKLDEAVGALGKAFGVTPRPGSIGTGEATHPPGSGTAG
ncbi:MULTISPECIES: FUSC family protein [Prauserella salsuginis group]|uniref:FUSC family protein n=2 Tax=Prauserella salsuginis group TaxID=2893672 RepID=A0ABW6G4I5_9PSEU|nr:MULTISPECIES: FUSC family protein [Prauserella salsuginis group]MBB3666347.1 putative membrane protein YccC [Prauserella sediminis]